MEFLEYLIAIVIGTLFGLVGAGGGVITIPVLVFVFGINPVLATSYSLFIVAVTSFFGTLRNYFKGNINLKLVAYFGTSSVITVFLIRKFVLKLIPNQIHFPFNFHVSKDSLTLFLFSILMIFASVAMIRSKKRQSETLSQNFNFTTYIIYGLIVGLITGFLGAGGGFVLIPTLVFLFNLKMKNAVATSLAIIMINTIVGFIGDLGNFQIDWLFLIKFSICTTIGLFIGFYFVNKINNNILKKIFGWFVLSIAIFIIFKLILKT